MTQTKITIYPNQIELRFIKKQAQENNRTMSNYIITLVQEKMQEKKQ